MARGFTLLEVMVVILILGIAAGAVALSSRSPLHRADMDRTLGEIIQLDQLTRRQVIVQGRPLQLVFDLSAGRIGRQPEQAGPSTGSGQAVDYVLPRGFKLKQLVLADGRIASGKVAIWCSGHGTTPSYAVLIAGVDSRRWLLLAGLTGQAVRPRDEDEVQKTMALLSPQRHDAH